MVNTGRHSRQLVGSTDAMNGLLMRRQPALGVEDTLTVFHAAEERHLVSDAEQRAVFLALVPVQAALVQETEATVAILTQVRASSFIIVHVLKRPQITPRSYAHSHNTAHSNREVYVISSWHIYASCFSATMWASYEKCLL